MVNRVAFGTVLTMTQWLGIIVLSAMIVAMSRLAARGPRLVGVVAPSDRSVAGAHSDGET